MTAIILTTIFLLHAFFTSCDLIETKLTFVKECPKNKNEQIQASTKLKCGVDEYNNSQYFCLPLVNKTSLVELCFNGGLGRWEEGNCLETDGEKIYSYNCSNFSSGCPEEDFFDYEFYIYPACLNISTEFHCYLFDPFCSTQLKTANEVKETKTHEVKETTTHEVKETTTHEVEETTHGPKNNTSKSFLGVLSVVVFVLVVIFVIGIFVLKRKYWGNKDSGVNEMNGIDDQGTALLPQGVGTIPPAETQVDGSIQEPKTPNGDSLNQGMSTTNTQEEIISSNPETPLSDTSPRPFTPATPNEDGSIKASDTPNEAGPQPSTSESQITGGETTKSGSLNETNNDEVAGIKFAILFDDLADNFPEKKLQKLKDLIQSSKKVNNIESLNKARSARDCFRILNSENHFTESDVLFVQFLLRRTGCKKLNHNCEEYAKEQRALGFYEKQTENGYIHVYFHVTGDLSNFSKEKRRKVKEIVAAMVGSKTDQVYFDGYRRLESFLAIVSIETIYVGKLVAINKKDRYRFVDLDIDYFLVDFMKVILKISQESQRVDYHEHDKKTEQHTIIQPRERTFVPSSTFEVDICTGILHKIADEESMETSLKSQDVAYHEPVQKTEHTIIPPHKSRFVPSKVRGETSLGFLHKMEYEESMETSLKSQDVAYHEPVQKTEHKIKTLHERHFVPYKVIPKKTHGFLHTMADETEMEKLLGKTLIYQLLKRQKNSVNILDISF